MHIAPKRLPELQGRHNLAGMRQQQPERGKLLGRQVNHRLAAQQRAIGLQPESSKREFPALHPALSRARLRAGPAQLMQPVPSDPTQSLAVLVNLLAGLNRHRLHGQQQTAGTGRVGPA
jgi:hypothetical protein